MLADLTQAVAAGALSREQVRAAMAALLDPAAKEDAKAEFLRAWARRGETPAELALSAEELLPRARDPGVRGTWNGRPLLDCCGTGGGGLNLLNISTGIVFILAALGVPVVKHGNRGLTKKSGSADVLEALGIRIDLPPAAIRPCLEEVGAAFLFAPAYHTSFSVLAPVRRRLGAEGQRTIFNLLGPLLNPARPDARLVGVFQQDHVQLYVEALKALQCPNFTVVAGRDKMEEIEIGEVSLGPTLTGSTLQDLNGQIDFSFEIPRSNELLETLHVKDARDSARRIKAILSNQEKGLARDLFVINAAVASRTLGGSSILADHVNDVDEALDSGRALAVLRKWQDFSKRH